MSVIIVGGGMAGATLALAISFLTQGNMEIDLIELSPPDKRSHPGFNLRTIALSQGTCQQLMRVCIWSALRDCTTAITQIHVSDRGHPGFVNLYAKDYKITALGQVIKLCDASHQLFKLLKKANGITLHCPAQVMNVVRSSDQVEILLNNGKRIIGKLLVAADGSRSELARACNIQWQQSDYLQFATIANITTTEDPQGRAFERFTSDGPLAILPISEGCSSLVWCRSWKEHQKVTEWDDDSFIDGLQQAFGWRLGRILKVSERYIYPLSLVIANRHVSHRLALVGDAAQTLHPIAGQGFNLGIRDVMLLAEMLAEAAYKSKDPGNYSLLNRYTQLRQQDQKNTIAMTNNLIHLFSNHYGSLIVGRNLGLLAMEHLPVIRDAFVRRMLGWINY